MTLHGDSRVRAFPIASGVLLLGLLLPHFGCGGGEKKQAGTHESYKITLWEQMDPGERALQTSQIEAYQLAHPGNEILVSHYSTEDLRTQFQTAALAGGGPDLVYGPSDQVGPFSVMDLIHPIEALFPPDELAQFRSDAFDHLGGHVYALPDQVGNHLTLIYNKALLAEPPATMAELLRVGKEQSVDDNGDGRPDRYGLVFQVMEPFWTIPFLTGYGGWVMDEKSEPTLNTEAMVKALTLIRSFRDQGITPAECDYEIADTIFKEGRAAMIINGPWSWEAYRKAGLDVGLARIPKIDETGLWPAPMISSKGYSVNKQLSGKRLEAVLSALRYLTQTEFQVQYATQVGTLPTRKQAYERPGVSANPTLNASSQQVEVGRRMPVVAEMRAIWDAMRPSVQNVWNGAEEPTVASQKMQALAVKTIQEMKR